MTEEEEAATFRQNPSSDFCFDVEPQRRRARKDDCGLLFQRRSKHPQSSLQALFMGILRRPLSRGPPKSMTEHRCEWIKRRHMLIWVGHWDPFSFLPLLALRIAVIVLSSGQSGPTKSKVLQILFAGDVWPTQLQLTPKPDPASCDVPCPRCCVRAKPKGESRVETVGKNVGVETCLRQALGQTTLHVDFYLYWSELYWYEFA